LRLRYEGIHVRKIAATKFAPAKVRMRIRTMGIETIETIRFRSGSLSEVISICSD
jgi:hypothetical protein